MSDTVTITCTITNSGVYPAGTTAFWYEDSPPFVSGSWSAGYPDDGLSHTFFAYVSSPGYIDSAQGSATFP